MISSCFRKPALVAGFFLMAPSVNGQVETASPAGVLPYVQGDTSVDTVVGQPAAIPLSDSRSIALRVQQLEEEIRRLNGLVEEQQSLLLRLQDQSLERYVEIDRRLAAVGTTDQESLVTDVTGESEAGSNPPDSSSTDPVIPEVQPGEQEAYQAAYGLVRERRFQLAVSSFKAFLADYPFGRYAPNAHYWLGELYLVIEPADPESARQNFQLLLDQYPNDRKVPDALYKLGRVHALKGNMARSREYLNRVINDYGEQQHPAAQLAQDFLNSQNQGEG